MTEAMHQVLVIEDEPAIRNVLKVLLEAERYRVIEADTALRAEIETRSHKPDLLLIDLGLPDGDGLTVIRRVRAWSPVPIVVLSARTIARQIVSPRPAPTTTPSSLPRWNLSKSFAGSPAGNPGPSSSTTTRTESPS